MKKLHKLYKILLDYYTEVKGGYVCMKIEFYLDIPPSERILLLQHFKSQKPTENLHPEFYNHPLFIKHSTANSAWWVSFSDPAGGKQVRIEFIKKMIEITK